MKELKVVVKEPGKNPYEKTINDELKALQKEVGGYLESAYVPPNKKLTNVVYFVNENGKMENLKPNVKTPYDILCGNILVCGTCGEELRTLSSEEIRTIKSGLSELAIEKAIYIER